MMREGFLPFALPDIGEDEIAEVVDTLRSGWLTTGPKARRFEKEFAALMGDGFEAIAVNSATSGLHLALEALGVGPEDEVLTTPFTFTATAEVVRYLGAHPKFVDIDPHTLNMDPAKMESALSPRTKGVMPVHFAGLACDMEPVLEFARANRLHVVEDAAHSLPTTYKGALIGTLDSDLTVFSFYATKTLATGEGGMVVTRNAEAARRCRVMRLHGIDRDAFDRYTSDKPAWSYEVIAPGFKYNLTDVAAAIGIQQLAKLDRFQKRREQMALRYDQELRDLPLKLPAHPLDGDRHAWHLYVVQLKDDAPLGRDEFIGRMSDKGVGCGVHFIPLHLHPYWRDTYGLRPEDFPVATDAFRRVVSLPLYTRMSDDDQTRVIAAVRSLLG